MKNILNDLVQSFLHARKNRKILIYILAFLYLLAILMVVIKVDYEIYTPGVINTTVMTNGDDKDYAVISFENGNLAGKIHTVGIYTHKRVSIYQYLLAKLSLEIDEYPYDPKTDASDAEDHQSGVLQKEYSIIDALIVAYQAAHTVDPSIKIFYDIEGLQVIAISKKYQKDLQIGDLITEINGQPVNNVQQFEELLLPIDPSETISLTIKRDGEEIVVTTQKRRNIENEYVLPFSYHDIITIDKERTTPKFQILEDRRSTGSSGGAMMALAIYNALTEGDITKGKFIIGTGTINLDGSLGRIGGIRQKIATAAMYDVDIFFVDKRDYKAAYAMYEKIRNRFKPEFCLISVEYFQDILDKLEDLS
jgi:PDZ domain-containing protein